MDNSGSSVPASKPAAKKTAASTTGTRTTGTRSTTATGTNTNSTEPAPRVVPRIVAVEPRSRPNATGSATRPPASPSAPPGISAGTLDNIVSRLAKALDGKTYAIMGGAARALLNIGPSGGSVDLLVPSGATSKMTEKLCTSRNTSRFKYSVSQERVFYERENGADIPIRFWEPKAVHQECPREMTDLVMVGDARVLKPTLLLNIACYNWLKYESKSVRAFGRPDVTAESIDLLVKHIAKQTKREVSNATGEFLIEFAAARPEAHAGFRDLGILGPN